FADSRSVGSQSPGGLHTIEAERQVPNPVIAAIALSKHLPPLRPRETGIMVRLTFSVMGLSDSDELLSLAVESLSMALLLTPKFRELCLRQAHLIHRALPTGVTPPAKIFINALALQPIESGHGNHFPRTPPINMMIERDQRVTADDRPSCKSVEKSTERSQQIRMITKRFRLTVLFGHQRVEQKQRSAWNFGASTDEKPLEVFRTPTQRKLLMLNVIIPLAGLPQESFCGTCRTIQQHRQCL